MQIEYSYSDHAIIMIDYTSYWVVYLGSYSKIWTLYNTVKYMFFFDSDFISVVAFSFYFNFLAVI